MDALDLLRGFAAGFAATAAMVAVQALAWALWGRPAVFEWQEAEVGAERLLGRRSLRAALVLHFLVGGVVGVAFALGVGAFPVAPAIALGPVLGFAMWVITLVIDEPVTGVPARGIGASVSLVGHLVYGSVLGLGAA